MQPFVPYTLCISSEHTSLHVNESFIAGGTAPGAYYRFIAGALLGGGEYGVITFTTQQQSRNLLFYLFNSIVKLALDVC